MQPTEFNTGVIKPFECLKEAWELVKPNYWLLFAILMVGALIGGMSLYVLIGAMMCGIMYCFLRQIDGDAVKFEDLWKGFSYFWPSLPTAIVVVVPLVLWIVILTFTIYLPIVMAAMMGDRLSGNELMATFGGVFVFDLIVAIIMICFHTLVTFAFPLVVDRGLTGFQPIVVSARAVLKNLGGIGGLIGLNFLMVLAGYAACGVGLYLVMPLMMATTLVAYRKVFPAMSRPNLNPPPPNVYSGLQ
jgi:uncharacterized membrane protein